MLLTAEASYHSPFDHITAAFLKQAGVNVDHIKLQEHGFRGNGHMFVMEKNSAEIAGFVHKWLLDHLK
jgi:hypothetical protein